MLQSLLSFRCTDIQKSALSREVTEEEVRSTIFAMPLNKSSGPDGYCVEFLRASWDKVGPDVIKAVREFFVNGMLLKDLNTTAITLIPKKPEACKLGDYRPISCCNLVYKVISKIIANRLKPVLQLCISPNQAAFLKGRSLGENVLLASDLIRNYEKSTCARSCMIKVDIRKAFDTVCWDFVLNVLEAQDFPLIFRTWVKECISSPRFSININGELAGFFAGKKGLRQGDSISPYLFIMVMEVLSKLLETSCDRNELIPHPNCENPRVTHLLFADDLLVFSDGSQRSLESIKGVLAQFKDWCGLDMNEAKSEIYFGGFSDQEAASLGDYSGIKRGCFPTRYLGLPLNPKRISFATLQPFLERITAKLHCWTVKFLSFAGKVKLISSVIYGMVNFWSAVFNLPKRFYTKVDSLCSAFLWKNSTASAVGARVSWDNICRPKCEGGLGLRKLEESEIVFRLKMVWIFFTNAGSLWVAWLKNNVFHRRSYWLMEDAQRLSPTVRSMLQLKDKLNDFLRCDIGDGASASFWYDSWTDFGPLIGFIGDTGPRQLRLPQEAYVSAACNDGFWSLPAARSETVETLQIALTSIDPPAIIRGSDTYLWKNAAGNFVHKFSSKDTWENLRTHQPQVNWHNLVWFKEEVPRYSFVVWMSLLSRLPTRDRLREWGMEVPPGCVLCSTGTESHGHLFFQCHFAQEIWSRFLGRFLSVPPIDLPYVVDLLQQPPFGHQPPLSIVLKLIVQAVVYHIWRERNRRIFQDVSLSGATFFKSVDRALRDRLISFPSRSARSPSLLELYFRFLGAIS